MYRSTTLPMEHIWCHYMLTCSWGSSNKSSYRPKTRYLEFDGGVLTASPQYGTMVNHPYESWLITSIVTTLPSNSQLSGQPKRSSPRHDDLPEGWPDTCMSSPWMCTSTSEWIASTNVTAKPRFLMTNRFTSEQFVWRNNTFKIGLVNSNYM